MARVTFKWDSSNIEAFLKGPTVRSVLSQQAGRITQRVGTADFSSEVRVGADRARAYVVPAGPDARRLQQKEHILEKAVGGL